MMSPSSDASETSNSLHLAHGWIMLFDLDGLSAAKRLRKCNADASRFGRVPQGYRHRQITEHGVHESLRFELEGLRKALIESRRAFVAHALGIGYLHTIEPRVLSDCQATACTDDFG